MKPLADRLADLRMAVEPCDKEAAALLLEAENAIRAWTVVGQAGASGGGGTWSPKWAQCVNPAFLPENWSE